MSETFDPYRKWLGIPPKEQPPHHYRLLGIAAFEDDPDVIDNAAARQMAHLKTFKTSRYAAESQRLLSEIAAAKLCLLTPESKAAYDEQLRKDLAAAGMLSSSQVVPPPVEEPPPQRPEAPAQPRVGSRWREDGLFDPDAVGPAPVPIPMPVPAAAAPNAPFVPAPIFTGPPPPASVPVGIPVAAAPAVPVIRRSSGAAARARRKQNSLPVVITVISLLVLATAGGIAALVANLPDKEAQQPNTAPPPAAASNAEKQKPLAAPPAEKSDKGAAVADRAAAELARLPKGERR